MEGTARRDHRPRFHVSSPTGWLNDPNGLVQRDGGYHVFFQHNAAAPVWSGPLGWGHAVSSDLVHWTHLPDALAPSAEGPDRAGCWSGCIVDDGGVPTAVYSGLATPSPRGSETICLARSEDADLVRWRKDPHNPVLSGPPDGLRTTAFRDPSVWREDGGWSMLVGAGLDGAGGAALRFRSPDLADWTYAGVVLSADGAHESPYPGLVWECPQLFPLGDRHVLLVSVWEERPPHTQYALAFVGDYRDGRFEPERAVRFDHGADCYAPATMLDGQGRRLAWAWSWEARDEAAAREQGWAGVLTVPRVLTLTAGGELGIAPAPELAALRGAHESAVEARIGRELVPETRGDRLELAATVAAGSAETVTVRICASPAGEEETAVVWDPARGRLAIDRSRSSLDPRARGGVDGGPLDAPDGELELRILVDRSIVEVFANGRFALAERIYPTRDDSTGVSLAAVGGEAELLRLDVWRLDGGEA